MIEHPAQPCYRVTDAGLRTTLFFIRHYNRPLRPGLAASFHLHSAATTLGQALHITDNRITTLLADGKFAPQLDTFATMRDRSKASAALECRLVAGNTRPITLPQRRDLQVGLCPGAEWPTGHSTAGASKTSGSTKIGGDAVPKITETRSTGRGTACYSRLSALAKQRVWGLGRISVGSYLVRRFGLMLLTLFGISVIIFVMLRIAPGNIADILFDAAGFVDPAEKAQIMKDLGLDQPLPIQYATWIGGLLHGDLGYSYVTDRPALAEILPRIPITARIAGLAVCFAALIGIPLGVVSAVKQNTRLDYILRVLSLSALSMPNFWLGLLVLMGFVAYFGTIPIYSDAPQTFWAAFIMYSVPALVVGVRSQALIMRLTRSSMLEVLRQDYIRTARSKGASENVVNFHHALKNAVLPVITVLGLEIAILMGGLVVIETVFNIPGVARFLIEAIRWRDYPIVQNIIMYIAMIVVLVNFTVDMLYAALDPRIKYSD
jgi:peptide/nickel transport system permease protein